MQLLFRSGGSASRRPERSVPAKAPVGPHEAAEERAMDDPSSRTPDPARKHDAGRLAAHVVADLPKPAAE